MHVTRRFHAAWIERGDCLPSSSMLRRLFTNLRADPRRVEVPTAPALETSTPPLGEDGLVALQNWLKWDRLPALDINAVLADETRARAATLLAQANGEDTAEYILRERIETTEPDGADLILLAEIFLRRGKNTEAGALLDGLASFAPASRARAACIKGQLDFDRGDFILARRWVNIALEFAPHSAAVQLLNGTLLEVEGRLDEAEKQLRALIAARPEDFSARISLGVLLERKGLKVQSLQELVTADTLARAPDAEIPQWDGRDLDQDTMLITTNAGIGDILQGLRYVKPVRTQAARARLVLWTRQELAAVARLTGLFDDVRTDPVLDSSEFDWQISLERLTFRHFAIGPALPMEQPYVHCATERLQAMRAALERATEIADANTPGPRPLRVGLRWSGARSSYDARRSIPRDLLRPLFGVPGVAWVALLERGHPEIPWLHEGAFPLIDMSASLTDLADTAALMHNLDLVISVDTSTAHLAGAVGARCWLLSRPDADARWGLESEQSTLYDSVQIFRHPGRIDWRHIIADCARQLAALATPSSTRN